MPRQVTSPWLRWLYRWLPDGDNDCSIGLHAEVESRASQRDRRQASCARTIEPGIGSIFTGPSAVGICSETTPGSMPSVYWLCLHRIDLFFAFILVPMNLALIALWFWQRSADRKFLASL